MKKILLLTTYYLLLTTYFLLPTSSNGQVILDNSVWSTTGTNITPKCGWTMQYEQSVGAWQVKPPFQYSEEFVSVATNLPVPNNSNFVAYIGGTGQSSNTTAVDGDVFGRIALMTGVTGNGYVGIGTSSIFAGIGTTFLTAANNHSYTFLATNVQLPALSTSTQEYRFYIGLLGGVTYATTLPSSGCFFSYIRPQSLNWVMQSTSNGLLKNTNTNSNIPVTANVYYNLGITLTNYSNVATVNYYIGVGTLAPNSAPNPFTATGLIRSEVVTMSSADKFGWGAILGKSLTTTSNNSNTVTIDALRMHIE